MAETTLTESTAIGEPDAIPIRMNAWYAAALWETMSLAGGLWWGLSLPAGKSPVPGLAVACSLAILGGAAIVAYALRGGRPAVPWEGEAVTEPVEVPASPPSGAN